MPNNIKDLMFMNQVHFHTRRFGVLPDFVLFQLTIVKQRIRRLDNSPVTNQRIYQTHTAANGNSNQIQLTIRTPRHSFHLFKKFLVHFLVFEKFKKLFTSFKISFFLKKN